MRTLLYYQTDFGEEPVREFLEGLPWKPRVKVDFVLRRVAVETVIPSKFWRKLSGQENLWEVRVEYAGNIYRILAALGKDNHILLLHAFQKKTQATPGREIEVAQQRKKRYFQRHGYL